jgi:hypothetical protein
MLTCDFKHPCVYQNKTEPLGLWPLGVHLAENLIEENVGSNNARGTRCYEYGDYDEVHYGHMFGSELHQILAHRDGSHVAD